MSFFIQTLLSLSFKLAFLSFLVSVIYEEVSSVTNDDYFNSEVVENISALDPLTGISHLTLKGRLDSTADRDYFLIKTTNLITADQSLDDLVVWIRPFGSARLYAAYGLRSAQSFLGVLPSRLVGRSRSGSPGLYWGLSTGSPDFVVDIASQDLPVNADGAYKLELLFGPRDFVALDRYVRESEQATPLLSLRAVNAVRYEGNTGLTTPFTFSVTRSANLSLTSQVQWSVRGTTTQTASADDFVNNRFPTGTLVFAPGETSKILTVDVKAGRLKETDETFVVQLHSPVNASISIGSASGTILNDDDALPSATFSNGTSVPISGWTKQPKFSTLKVDQVTGTISSVTVTLKGLSHAFADDLDIALISPSGVGVVLMSDAGGSQKLDKLTLAFSDQALSKLPDTSELTLQSGLYKPTNYNQPLLEPKGDFDRNYGSLLSVYKGQSPNGTWRLCISDDSIIDDGVLSKGWSLQFDLA